MGNTIGYHIGTKCDYCDESFRFDVWVIVDVQERPDLLEKILDGKLHDAICSRCGHPNHINADILLYRHDKNPVLLFSPTGGSDIGENRKHLLMLLNLLRKNVDKAWKEEWLSTEVISVERSHLPHVLSKGSGYLQKQEIRDGKTVQLVQELIYADQWDGTRKYISQHPEVLSEDMDFFLSETINKLKAQGDRVAKDLFDEYRRLLRRCREIGITNAIAEKKKG